MIAKFFSSITHQILVGIIALFAVLLAVQTVRLEGFKVWPVSIEGWKPKAERLERDLANVKQAQILAAQKALQVKIQAEQKYRDIAKRAEDHEKEIRHDALDAAERYIAAHRLRPQATYGASSGTSPTSEDRGAGVYPDMPPDTLVAVSDADVRACSEWVGFGIAARSYVLEMSNQGD